MINYQIEKMSNCKCVTNITRLSKTHMHFLFQSNLCELWILCGLCVLFFVILIYFWFYTKMDCHPGWLAFVSFMR